MIKAQVGNFNRWERKKTLDGSTTPGVIARSGRDEAIPARPKKRVRVCYETATAPGGAMNRPRYRRTVSCRA
jgi:hypothetical protein